MRILRQLSEAMGVSGAEGEVRRAILTMIEPHVDQVESDTLGNILAYKYGTGSWKRLTVLVDAHMDEVGLMVGANSREGMLKVAAIGGVDPRILLGQRVLVGRNKLPGVVGAKPIHLLSTSERTKVVGIDSIEVDIGVTSKNEALTKAPPGTRIGFDSQFVDLGTTVRGKAFDDRAGCAVLVHLLRGDRFPCNLVASFTVQEEVGLRGAKVVANRVQPDAAFALEGTIADDLPKEDDVSPTTELGKGPALSLMDRSVIFDRRLNALLTDTAAELGIPCQFKQPGIGGTNAGSINTAGVGVPVAAVSVPCRYIHSPAAILNKKDYRNTVKLVREALSRLDPSVLAR
jgi:putative aminopeptidase FrvX